MDNLTHSLVGAIIGQAGLKRKTGLAMPALIIGANLPDVDAACFLWLDGVDHLGFRRGITHGPIAWVLLPLVLAGLLYAWDRRQAKRGKRPEGRLPVHFGWLYALSFIACLTHPALDWLNVYGIRLLEPFSSRWFYGDVLFIIDVWLWAIIGLGLWLSLRREKRGGEWKTPARVAIAVALAYIGMNWAISSKASDDVAMAYHNGDHDAPAIASPLPIAFWDREVIRTGLIGDVAVIYNLHLWRVGQGIIEEDLAPAKPCNLRSWGTAFEREDSQIEAFLFWSRTPFAERAPDGSTLLRDARFYDPRARSRFTVALPDVECEPLP